MRTLPDGFRTNSATRFLTRSTGFTVSLGFGGGCGLSAKATSTFFLSPRCLPAPLSAEPNHHRQPNCSHGTATGNTDRYCSRPITRYQ